MAWNVFREVYPPAWILQQNQVWMIELSCVNVIQCCMIIGWTYLTSSSFILFASNLEWLVTKIPEGIFSQLYSMLISQGYHNRRWKLILSSKSACFRTEARPWETIELCSKLVKWFPSNTNLCIPISRFMPMRFAIFMINICIYNHPFKVFMNKENEGVEDLVCGNVGETN